jgi:SAM-dependent methyltransferase
MAIMPTDRERLRGTFEAAAGRYDRARPAYPSELFGELFALTGVVAGDRVLEIGCGTGIATRSLAAHGLRVTCVELGSALAEAARRNLADLPRVEVHQAAFEDWQPPAAAPFDLVVAATAWHWIDPAVRSEKAWELLRPGGHLAYWSATHVFPDDGDPFFREMQAVYEEIGEARPSDAEWPKPGALPDERAAIEATGFFRNTVVRQFDWEVSYTADEYIELLETFSGHIAMEPWQRERLYGEIRRRLAERPTGMLRRHWGAVLHVAARA